MGEEEIRQYRHTDEVETVKFREQTHGALELLKSGNTLLHDCIDRIEKSFIEFKQGLGARMDGVVNKSNDHDVRLARIETSLGTLVKATWAIVLASVSIIVMAAWKLILK